MPTNEVRNIALTHVPADAASAYLTLASDPKYQHFVRIPERILQCVDYFGIACDRTATMRLLHIYYLFIGVVDDSIDAGEPDSGRKVLEYLSARSPLFDQDVRRSSVRLVTEILKSELKGETYPLMMKLMWSLHTQVINERAANSMESYINHRNSVGSLTAELSYALIRPGLGRGHEILCGFMRRVGAVGCLIDSLIDLRADRRVGLLGFTPGFADYGKLIHRVLRDGLRISLKHPGLSRLFLRAVIDNLQDRFRPAKRSGHDVFLPIRKDEAPNAA